MAKRQAIIKQQVNKALGNDPKAAALVVGQINRLEETTSGGPSLDLSRFQDPALISSIVARIRLNEPLLADLKPGEQQSEDQDRGDSQ